MKNKTTFEYPASHSVDTDWFAIDRDGRLAMLSSGEEGLLPANMDIGCTNEDGFIEDAMLLSSTEIEPGCRYFPLSDRHIKGLEESLYTDIEVAESEKVELNEYIIFVEKTNYKDLSIWINRDKNDNPMIYFLSENHNIIYVEHLSYTEGSFSDDIESGRIKAISFCLQDLFFEYHPYNPFENSIFLRNPFNEFDKDTSPIPPKFVLPDGFHNTKKYDISFLDSDEFDLNDFEDVYVKDMKDCFPEKGDAYYRPCKKKKNNKSDK